MRRKDKDLDLKKAEQALLEREQQYRSIFESTTDGMVITSPEGRIVEVNPAFCRMHGYTRGELLQLDPQQVIHPDYRHFFTEYMQQALAQGEYLTEAINVRKDGTQFDVEIHGTIIFNQGSPYVLGVVHDITERRRSRQLLEQRVEERTREISTLLTISQTVASMLELQPLLALIMDQLKLVVNYTGACLHILEGDSLELVAYSGSAKLEDAMRQPISLADPDVRATVLQKYEPIVIADLEQNTPQVLEYRRVFGQNALEQAGHVRAVMWVPLVTKQRLIGGLCVGHSEPGYLDERHAQFAHTIANQAAIAIENARLYKRAQDLATLQERQRLARELHDSVTQTLYSLTLLAEAGRRQAELGNIERVQSTIARLGQTAQQSLKEMRLLVYELRPLALAGEGLAGALQQRLDAVEHRAGIDATLQVDLQTALPAEVEEGLYGIAQEALNNSLKHSRATTVEILLFHEGDAVVLHITDNGVGFNTAAAGTGGMGLVSMRERAERLEGTLTLNSASNRGTSVLVWIPLPAAQ